MGKNILHLVSFRVNQNVFIKSFDKEFFKKFPPKTRYPYNFQACTIRRIVRIEVGCRIREWASGKLVEYESLRVSNGHVESGRVGSKMVKL